MDWTCTRSRMWAPERLHTQYVEADKQDCFCFCDVPITAHSSSWLMPVLLYVLWVRQCHLLHTIYCYPAAFFPYLSCSSCTQDYRVVTLCEHLLTLSDVYRHLSNSAIWLMPNWLLVLDIHKGGHCHITYSTLESLPALFSLASVYCSTLHYMWLHIWYTWGSLKRGAAVERACFWASHDCGYVLIIMMICSHSLDSPATPLWGYIPGGTCVQS